MSAQAMTAAEVRELVDEAKTVVGGLLRSHKQRVARESAEMYASLVIGDDDFHHQARVALNALWLTVLRRQRRYAETEPPLRYLIGAGYFEHVLIDGVNITDHYLADLYEARGEYEKAATYREAFARTTQQHFGADSERGRLLALRAEATRARANSTDMSDRGDSGAGLA